MLNYKCEVHINHYGNKLGTKRKLSDPDSNSEKNDVCRKRKGGKVKCVACCCWVEIFINLDLKIERNREKV